jgi:hypothetical protein
MLRTSMVYLERVFLREESMLTIGGIEVHLRVSHEFPQLPTFLDNLGAYIMDAAGTINEAIDRVASVVEQEAMEIADLVRANSMTPEATQAIVERLDGLAERVRGFAPTPEPEPES